MKSGNRIDVVVADVRVMIEGMEDYIHIVTWVNAEHTIIRVPRRSLRAFSGCLFAIGKTLLSDRTFRENFEP